MKFKPKLKFNKEKWKRLHIDRAIALVAGFFYTLDAVALVFVTTFTGPGVAVNASYNEVEAAREKILEVSTALNSDDAEAPLVALLEPQQNLPSPFTAADPVYVVNSSIAGKKALKEKLIEDTAEKLDIDLDTVDKSKSSVNFVNNAGIQNSNDTISMQTVTVQLKDTDGKVLTNLQPEQADIIVHEVSDTNSGPEIVLKNTTMTVNNGDSFNPMNNITYIEKQNDVLPVITIDDSAVDNETDGIYPVTVKAVGNTGAVTELEFNVEVKTPEEVIKAREEAERLAREEEERRAAEEAAAAARQNQYSSAAAMSSPYAVRGSGYNPYSGGWSNCTWGAWQALYDARGIALPGLGNACEWYYRAANLGYSVGYNPAPGSIVVWAYALTNLGHVAYVTEVSADGSMIHIIEGGYLGGYMDRWCPAHDSAMTGYIYP